MPRLRTNIFRRLTVIILSIICITIPVLAAKSNDFVVVIDAGHGGKDTGAQDNSAVEKDINLGVAQRLADILKKKKGFKVVMTRDGDKFVNLNDRAAKANKEKADLFISIHTNSVDASNPNRKNIEGASVYVLGLHRDNDNLAVARRENSVISQEKNHEEKYEGFDPDKDESYIVFEMAQKKNLSNSIGFAQEVEKELVKTAGRKDRGVHQAGFLVLRETAMPSVLIELDFICNPNSARYINSSTGQKKMAQAIANAVVTYRDKLKKNTGAYASANLDGEEPDTGDVFVLVSDRKSNDRRASAVASQPKSKSANTPRKRRSASARQVSEQRNLETDHIAIHSENRTSTISAKNGSPNKTVSVAKEETKVTADTKQSSKKKQDKKEKKQKERKNQKHAENTAPASAHDAAVSHSAPTSSNPRSLKSSKGNKKQVAEVEIAEVDNQVAGAFRKGTSNVDEEIAAEERSEKYSQPNEAATARRRASETVKTTERKSPKDERKQAELMEKQAAQNVKTNNEDYQAAKQKSVDNYQTSKAPKSLKAKKK